MTASTLPRTCSKENCDKKHKAYGLCVMHYTRLKNHGDADICLINLGIGDTPEERFWSRVNRTADTSLCWTWTGTTNSSGYGLVRVNGPQILAHRASWFYTYGVMPTMFILHSCDNPVCVNPAHLREGTQQDNMNDRSIRNRTARMKGEKHPHAKLTMSQVVKIRALYASGGISHETLGAMFSVSRTNIGQIVRGTAWT